MRQSFLSICTNSWGCHTRQAPRQPQAMLPVASVEPCTPTLAAILLQLCRTIGTHAPTQDRPSTWPLRFLLGGLGLANGGRAGSSSSEVRWLVEHGAWNWAGVPPKPLKTAKKPLHTGKNSPSDRRTSHTSLTPRISKSPRGKPWRSQSAAPPRARVSQRQFEGLRLGASESETPIPQAWTGRPS